MTESAFSKIKGHFWRLLIKVKSALEAQHVDVKEVRQFLLTYFEGECTIPNVANLSEVLDSVTTAKLWRYDHYEPLEELAESFLPDDDSARRQMIDYPIQLSAFQGATRIIDFIKLSELEDPEEDDQPFSPKKYNRHYRKLTMELNLGDVSEATLDHMDKLWKALQRKFKLPSLTAVIDKIVQGSVKVTWLVLPHVIKKIKAALSKSVTFFQQHNITRIAVCNCLILYDEKVIVSMIHFSRWYSALQVCCHLE